MKTAASLFLMTSLLFIALFGLSALEHSMGHEQTNCAISLMSSTLCPTNIVSVMEHHILAIQKFFNVPVSVFMVLLASLITVSILGLAYLYYFLILHSQYISQRLQASRERFNFSKCRLISWLSLFEHSPSF